MTANNVKALTAKALATLLLAAQLPVASADELQNIADIAAVAEEFALSQLANAVYTDISVDAGTLDPRLRMQQCDQQLEAFSTNSGVRAGRTTVGVRCVGTRSWTLYVPLQINASVNVVTLRSPLQRGAVLSEQDLVVITKPFATLPPQYVSDLNDVLGKELTRNLGADTVLAPQMLKEHPVISKGQEVVILASSPNFEVKMAGTALQNGAPGERINVKNNNSGRTVQAIIVNNNTVRVQL
jgi:flagellar basal body P-ring formation protein FlgA